MGRIWKGDLPPHPCLGSTPQYPTPIPPSVPSCDEDPNSIKTGNLADTYIYCTTLDIYAHHIFILIPFRIISADVLQQKVGMKNTPTYILCEEKNLMENVDLGCCQIS